MTELKAIPGFDGYLVSADGDVFSLREGYRRELTQRMHRGYRHVTVRCGVGRDAKVKVPTHRLVLLAWIGERPSRHSVGRHLDGNPLNNSAVNLAWGSRSDNATDSLRHGTAACLRKGERHPSAKLSYAATVDIRSRLAAGERAARLADEFSVSDYHIRDIGCGRVRLAA